jgi:cholesterol oxidase
MESNATAALDFDTIVIGSGFGGSVTAAVLAKEHGDGVCLLERGRAYPPGSFPREPYGYGRNFWDPSKGRYGLFQVWKFKSINSVVSSGLGGGSLIYANVILRKDANWFVTKRQSGGSESWPITRAELDPHYDEVEKVLAPEKFPFDREPYSHSRKTVAFQQAAKSAQLEVFHPPLAISFGKYPNQQIDDGSKNYHGKARSSCRLCGECDVGCNTGSKNSLDYNFITQAHQYRAEIRTLVEVRRIEKNPRGGYKVLYVVHDPEKDSAGLEERSLSCRRVVLACGTFGSTYLLLQSRQALGLDNPMLGQRFCGNGDVLALVRHAHKGKTEPQRIYNHDAPVITSAVRVPDEADGEQAKGRGHYVQDAGVPEWVSWAVELANVNILRRFARLVVSIVRSSLRSQPDLSAALGEFIGDARSSTTQIGLLGMGRDMPDGKMSLEHGKGHARPRLALDWKDDGSEAYYGGVEATVKKLATALGGSYSKSLLTRYFNNYITVHPLGGCPMGRTAQDGVVDTYGKVFGLEDFYVADGSVMPGPVGPNPSFTIAALAHRFAKQMLVEDEARGLLPKGTRRSSPPSVAAAEARGTAREQNRESVDASPTQAS